MTGRIKDVLVTEEYIRDALGQEKFARLIIWADPGQLNNIRAVEGVSSALNPLIPARYIVYLDPRYDREYVAAEIEAAILCNPPEAT